MSFAEQVLQLKTDIDEVYKAGKKVGGGADYDEAYGDGYNQGYTEGESVGYDNGFTDGQKSVPNPLEYARSLNSTYLMTEFPENYEMTINIPLIASMTSCFQNATGIIKLTIKGNVAENAINMANAFRVPMLEILDLSEFNAIIGADGNNLFNGAKVLKEIKGTLDFTNVTRCSGVFNVCYVLEEVRFKENSIGVSIGFAQSSKLSATSIQSIIDGLAIVETAQTLTLPTNILAALSSDQMSQILEKNWSVE